MIVWVLLGLSAQAQEEPQSFEPQAVDVQIDGELFRGILIDEATYAELGQLRTLKTVNETKQKTWEEWKLQNRKDFQLAIDAVKTSAQERLQSTHDFYDKELKKAGKQDKLQKHLFPLGVAVGVVGSTAITLGALHFYGKVLANSVE